MLSGERPIIQLEESESVCFPSFRANQDTQRECGNSFDLSAVAGTTRVSSIVKVDDGYPHYYSSTSSTPIVSGRPPTPTNRDGINHSNRLEFIRRNFAGRGLFVERGQLAAGGSPSHYTNCLPVPLVVLV